jgi:hypothetical protein
MADLDLKVGEEKTITITYADSLDVSGATLSFAAKRDLDDDNAIFTKVDGDFDKTNAGTGIVTFPMDDTDVTEPMTLVGECTATFSGTSKDKTEHITIWVKKAVG